MVSNFFLLYLKHNCFFFLGNVGVNELLTTLIESVDIFSEHQTVEVKEEAERAERELVKWEQDEAYRASLEIDRYILITHIE